MIKTVSGFSISKMICLIGILSLTVSCVSREKIVYFQGETQSMEMLADKYSATIQPDDLLDITVYGRNMEVTRIFNQESNKGGQQTYLVDEEGYIEFPVLGKIKLAGMTRNEAIQYMKGRLSSDIIDPGVSIKITNFKITILGQVGSPGTYTIDNERITILEAFGMAGDITIDGLRENVLVIREEGDQRNFYRINMTSSDIFNSPVFYLAQNDVIYVEPDQRVMNTRSGLRNDTAFLISIAGFLLSIIVLITR